MSLTYNRPRRRTIALSMSLLTIGLFPLLSGAQAALERCGWRRSLSFQQLNIAIASGVKADLTISQNWGRLMGSRAIHTIDLWPP